MKLIRDIAYRGMQLSALVVMCSVPQTPFAAQGVIVKNAWARATAPGQNTASVYLEITSNADAAVVAAASPLAKTAEMHAMHRDGAVIKMRAVSRIELPAKKTVKLAPGGVHVMLFGIRQPLREKDRVPLELTVEGAGRTRSTVRVEAEVRSITAAASPHMH